MFWDKRKPGAVRHVWSKWALTNRYVSYIAEFQANYPMPMLGYTHQVITSNAPHKKPNLDLDTIQLQRRQCSVCGVTQEVKVNGVWVDWDCDG